MKKFLLINFLLFLVIISVLEISARFFKLADIKGTDNIYKGKFLKTGSPLYQFLFGTYELEMENGYIEIKPNIEGKVFGAKVYTDSNGFRIPNINFKYKKNISSILFVGDSTLFGNGVDEKKTFLGLIRSELKKTNIYNASAPGHNINANYSKIKNHKKIDNINKIILVYTLNDILDIEQEESLNKENNTNINSNPCGKGNIIKECLWDFIKPINHYLNGISIFYIWLKGTMTDPASRNFRYIYKLYENDKSIPFMKSKFMEIKNIVNESNIDFFVIILPYEFQTRKNNCINKLLFPQKIISNILNDLEIEFIDYTNVFCEQVNTKELFLKFDPMHLSKHGHAVVYNEILSKIKKN